MSSFETRGALRTAFSLEFPPIGQFLSGSLKNNRLLRRLAGATVAAGVLLSGAGCGTNPEAGSLQAIPVATASPFESPSATPTTFIEASPSPTPSPTPSEAKKTSPTLSPTTPSPTPSETAPVRPTLTEMFLTRDKLTDEAFFKLSNTERDEYAEEAVRYYAPEIAEAVKKDPNLPAEFKKKWPKNMNSANAFANGTYKEIVSGLQEYRTAIGKMAMIDDPLAKKRALKSILSLDRINDSMAVADITKISAYQDYLDIKAGKEPRNFIMGETTQVVDSVCTSGSTRGMNTSAEAGAIETLVNVQVGDEVMYGVIKYTSPEKGSSQRWGILEFSDSGLVVGPHITKYDDDCAKVGYVPQK